MKKKILILSVISIIGCSTPKLSNLHRGDFEVSKQELNNLFRMDVNIVPIPEPKSKLKPKPKTFLDLRDSTQVHYIKELSSKIEDADKFIEALKKPVFVPKTQKSVKKTDYTTVKVRLYVNHVKQYHEATLNTLTAPLGQLIHPNSRIAWLNTEIRIKGSNCWQIETIDKIQTLYETIDLGTLNREQTVNLSVSGSIGYDLGNNSTSGLKDIAGNILSPQTTKVTNVYDENGNLIDSVTVVDSSNQSSNTENSSSNDKSRLLGTKAEASYGNATAIKEGYNLKFNEIKTGYSFSKKEILVSQKGSFSRDVSNVELITATLRYLDPKQTTVYSFKELFGDSGPNSAKDIEMDSRSIKYIEKLDENKDDYANIEFRYNGLFRAVKNLGRGKNMLEYDDKVIYYPFKSDYSSVDDEKRTISSQRHATSIYKIKIKVKGKKNPLTLENAKNNKIIFMIDEEEVYELKNWLEIIPTKEIDFLKNGKVWLQLSAECPSCRKTQLIGPNVLESDMAIIKDIEAVYFEEIKK
ncbi:hypothetical protein MTsPCn5_28790 [Croceitalea sp. MTPC5]|uniref:hypothetical protein n=1 Tax=Croceitalea sp. MTPC5 TaxID=3056565 RepID=UPI002B36C850|nr:hypothetical protein MTsPCn5_28790 [Croceitalea sp. MTPC5]